MLKFTKEHEWVLLDAATGVATVGITQHAVEQLGDLVFVELPDVGASLEKDGEAATVESVKAASDVYAPLDGEVVEVNQTIVDQPGLVNEEPAGKGWFFKMKLSDPADMDSLMSEDEYTTFVS